MTHSILKVRDAMSRVVHTVGRNDQLAVADKLMNEERIRHLPVLDEDGVVCAVVSQRDLFRGALLRALGYGGRAEQSMLRQVVVKEAMSENVVTTDPDSPLAVAAGLMVKRRIGCLPVVEGEKLVGILTETDVVRMVADGKLGPA